MKSIERFNAAIDLKPVDRIPNAPFYEAPICNYYGRTMRAALMESESMVKAHVEAVEHFQFDWAILGMNLIGGIIPDALGCRVTYPENELPRINETSVKTMNDIEKVAKAEVFTADMQEFLEGVAQVHARLNGEVPLAVEHTSPFTIATRLRGTNEIMHDFYSQPEMVTKLQEAIVPHAITIGKTLIDAGVEYIFYGADMECPLLISVDHYRQFVHGPTKRVVKALADMGGKVLPHMCGQIVKKGIVDLLMEMDIKGIMPGNLTQDTVLDITELKEKVQDRICIFGNLNPNGSLLLGTPEEVENETRSHLEKTRGMCGYIFSTAGTASAATPRANFEAMNQVVINFK